MKPSIVTHIGFRYARTGTGTSFIAFINRFSVAGIALGLAALIVLSSVMNGFEGQLKSRILGLMPHFVVHAPVDSVDVVHLPMVEHQQRFIETDVVIQSPRRLQGVMLHGLDHQDLPPSITEGVLSGLTLPKSGEYDIIIGRSLAIELDVRVGDRVRVLSAESSVFTPFGRTPSQRRFRVAGVFDVGSQFDGRVAMTHIDDTASLLRQSVASRAETRLTLSDPFLWSAVSDALDQQELKYTSWRARQGPLFDAVQMEKNMMSLMLALIIAVAAFNIVSAMVMVVNEKRGDIAILRTMGMSAHRTMGIFMCTGIYNGLKGVLLGLILGTLLASQLPVLLQWFSVQLLPGAGPLPVDMEPWAIAGMVIGCVSLTFFATLYPAVQALRVDPADALRHE